MTTGTGRWTMMPNFGSVCIVVSQASRDTCLKYLPTFDFAFGSYKDAVSAFKPEEYFEKDVCTVRLPVYVASCPC